jgi:dienelactone hydrolase
VKESLVSIPAGRVALEGSLDVPAKPGGIVVFSHGSGSGRHSPRNRFVAAELRRAGLATLLLDLLTPEEDQDYEMRFDIDLLTERLGHAVRFVRGHPPTRALPVGLFGASTGAASALRVAASMPEAVGAVVSRGGRPDLTGDAALAKVRAPTLLIVGALDTEVLAPDREAMRQLACEKRLEIVPRATHLFEEAGAPERVAAVAGDWFATHLTRPGRA